MRRAAMAFLIVGFMVGEMVQGLGWQPAAEAAGLAATANSVKAKPAKKTVTFGGYSVSVPANWPVYDLTRKPRRCASRRQVTLAGRPNSIRDDRRGLLS
jgi:hypothetical protein